jgi:hypothetical protein
MRIAGPALALLFLLQDVEYVKKATREETRAASIEATLKKQPALTLGGWKYIGPFDNAGGRGVMAKYPPELEIDLAGEYVGADKRMVKWQDGARFKDGAVINLNLFNRLNYSVCYLYRAIEADGPATCTAYVGSDDSVSVWVNGERVHDYLQPRGMPAKKDEVEIALKKGTNHLLFKVANWEGPTEFTFQLERLAPSALAKLEARLDKDFPAAGERGFYRIETIDTPRGVVFEVGGMGFWPDGSLVACTRRGEIWRLKGKEWTRWACGLHEPLGLCPGETGEVWCVQRPELTHVKDTDGDGEADLYETVSAGWGMSGHYHEFAFGPVRDKEGNFWGTLNVDFWNAAVGGARAPYRGWSFKVTPKGEFVPWSSGLRSPDGIGLSPDGELFVTDNQGDFLGTSPIHHITKGAFHGHPAGLRWDKSFEGDPFKTPMAELDKRRKPPAVLIPFGPMGHSPTEPVWDTTGGKFGPFEGHMFVGDQTQSNLVRVTLEKVGGEYQGACYPFRYGFVSGLHRLAFAKDGSLWVGQTDRGWDAVGGKPWGLQRVVWLGQVPFEIHTMSLVKDGFELTFTKPVDRETASRAASYSMQCYHYHYWQTYGSPQVANAPVRIDSVSVSEDGRKVTLVVPSLPTRKVYELHVKGVKGADGSELLHGAAYYTLNRVRP